MSTVIEQVSKAELSVLISREFAPRLTDEERKSFANCLERTAVVWVGHIDGDFVCAWGLVPPTLVSNIAYLWLHVTEAVQDHEFAFVRKSQIAIQKILEQYPMICGHCEVSASRSIRWLRWLGAVFSEPDGKFIPFLIKAKQDG